MYVPNSNFSSNNCGPKGKVLINGLSGYAESNRVMAIIGPSGSGKSTLLHALAGILPTNVSMTGNVLINGAKKSSACCRDISYLAQEDYFLGTLTVRETLTYSTHLRLPSNMTKIEIDNLVTKTIAEMGLEDIEDSRIGNWHLRGIMDWTVQLLSIVSSLRSIAHDGRIVIVSIHQPSGEVFNLFDDLIILAGGQTVYFGEITMALKFFADAGFPCPTRKNPPEHFLRCVSTEFDSVATFMQSENVKEVSSSWNSQITMTTEEIKFKLLETYKNSMHSANTKKKIRQIKLRKHDGKEKTHDVVPKKPSATSSSFSSLSTVCVEDEDEFLQGIHEVLELKCKE
ncbi:ABC transporter G family member [Trifolium repens]|nr:ABC transporter G family member [Trifolium repens]